MRAILTYHSVDPSGSVISVDEETFRGHADWLAEGPVEVVSIPELLEGPPGADRVAITFDDGFANFGSVAWPILRERGLPATVFVVTDFVGGTNRWNGVPDPGIPTLELLTWDQIARLHSEGVEVGSHTRRHPTLRGLTAERLAEELEGSRELLGRRLGLAPSSFAYPYGAIDDAAVAKAAAYYAWACTTELAPLGHDVSPHRLPRLDAYYFRRPDGLQTWGTAAFRARIAVRRQGRRVRSWLDRGVWE